MSNPVHLAVVLADGTEIVLPAAAWLDQGFVRKLFAKAGAVLPEFSNDQWLQLIALMAATAEEVD